MAKIKKLVIVLPSLEMGGAERQALNLATYIHINRLADVELWSLGPGQTVAQNAEKFGIPVSSVAFNPWLSKWNVGMQILSFAFKLFANKVEYLLPYVIYPNLLCCSAFKLAGVRRCFWQQRDEGRDRGPVYLEKIALRFADGFISNSTAGVSFLTGTLGVSSNRCHLIRNGVEVWQPQITREAWRAHHGFGNDQILVSMVANITKAKDHATLLRAWKLLIDSNATSEFEPTLLLVGQHGNASADVEKIITDLGLAKSVQLLGAVEDISSHLNAIDLFVFSSRMEGCPNAVLEAMGAGLAVVASDIPGTRDALGSDYPFLFEAGNELECATMIKDLLSAPDTRASQGAKNKARIESLFSLERMCRETIEVVFESKPGLN